MIVPLSTQSNCNQFCYCTQCEGFLIFVLCFLLLCFVSNCAFFPALGKRSLGLIMTRVDMCCEYLSGRNDQVVLGDVVCVVVVDCCHACGRIGQLSLGLDYRYVVLVHQMDNCGFDVVLGCECGNRLYLARNGPKCGTGIGGMVKDPRPKDTCVNDHHYRIDLSDRTDITYCQRLFQPDVITLWCFDEGCRP